MSASVTRLAASSGVAVLDGLLNETLRLAVEARGYLADGEGPGGGDADARLPRLVEACELSRLSARLSYCICWLLARRAVQEGAFGEEESREPRWRLEGMEICLDGGTDRPGELPPPLRDLLDRSLALYRRVARLDRRLDA